MPKFEITFLLTVAGIGEVAGRAKPILRTVDAENMSAAIEMAQKDIFSTQVIKAEIVDELAEVTAVDLGVVVK